MTNLKVFKFSMVIIMLLGFAGVSHAQSNQEDFGAAVPVEDELYIQESIEEEVFVPQNSKIVVKPRIEQSSFKENFLSKSRKLRKSLRLKNAVEKVKMKKKDKKDTMAGKLMTIAIICLLAGLIFLLIEDLAALGVILVVVGLILLIIELV